MDRRPFIAVVLAAGLTIAPVARADGTVRYQGRLTDAKGAGIASAELTVNFFDTGAATTPAVTLGPLTSIVFK